LPTWREDFLRDLNPDAEKDFAKIQAGKTNYLAEAIWEKSGYFECARVLRNVADEVDRRFGLGVVTRCTLADLRALFDRHRVVSLMAHWRSSQVVPSDIKDPVGIVARLRDPPDEICARLRRRLAGLGLERANSAEVTSDHFRRQLSAGLNATLSSGRLDRDDEGDASLWTPLLRGYFNRRTLDAALGGLIAPGNLVEFHDRLHPVPQVVAQIPTSFRGLIDLTVCNSLLLGEEIHNTRPEVLCITLPGEADIKFRAIAFRHVIRYLSRQRQNYYSALTRILPGAQIYRGPT
jgi:hypothetical protein